MQEYRDELGPLAFLFWVEVFILLILLPWAALNGELAARLPNPNPNPYPNPNPNPDPNPNP